MPGKSTKNISQNTQEKQQHGDLVNTPGHNTKESSNGGT